MIQGQKYLSWFSTNKSSRPFLRPAVLTEIMVPSVDVRPCQYRNPDRNFFVVPQSDNTRKGESRVYLDSVILFCDCGTFDQKL